MTDGVWYVQVTATDIRSMTLDELDDAYQADRIGEATLVLQPGTSRWARLGDVAGIDTPRPSVIDNPIARRDAVDEEADRAPRKRRRFSGKTTAIMALALLGLALTSTPRGKAVARSSIAAIAAAAGAIQPVAVSRAPAALSAPSPAPAEATVVKEAIAAAESIASAPSRRKASPTDARVASEAKLASKLELKLKLKDNENDKDKTHDRAKAPEASKKQPHAIAKPAPASNIEPLSPFHEGGDEHDPLNAAL